MDGKPLRYATATTLLQHGRTWDLPVASDLNSMEPSSQIFSIPSTLPRDSFLYPGVMLAGEALPVWPRTCLPRLTPSLLVCDPSTTIDSAPCA
jgi:hypothetical protein